MRQAPAAVQDAEPVSVPSLLRPIRFSDQARPCNRNVGWCRQGPPKQAGQRHFAWPAKTGASALTRISHTILARSSRFARRFGDFFGTCGLVASGGRGRRWDFPELRGTARNWSRLIWDDAAVVTRCGAACQAGEPLGRAAALRRTAARPQTSAAGQLDAIAILMRRTLTRTSAPILSNLRRMLPQVALANGV